MTTAKAEEYRAWVRARVAIGGLDGCPSTEELECEAQEIANARHEMENL